MLFWGPFVLTDNLNKGESVVCKASSALNLYFLSGSVVYLLLNHVHKFIAIRGIFV